MKTLFPYLLSVSLTVFLFLVWLDRPPGYTQELEKQRAFYLHREDSLKSMLRERDKKLVDLGAYNIALQERARVEIERADNAIKTLNNAKKRKTPILDSSDYTATLDSLYTGSR